MTDRRAASPPGFPLLKLHCSGRIKRKEGRKMGFCSECEDCKRVDVPADGLTFLGCFRRPYHGQWIKLIDKCPKDNQQEGSEKDG